MPPTIAVETDPAPPVPPGPAPDPTPTDPTPAVPIALPDGDPAAGALALLHVVRPDADGVLAARLERLEAELSDQVELWRLDTRLTLADFMAHAGRRSKVRAALLARAGTPPATSPAAEVLALLRSVRRWRPAEELRAERSRLIARLRAELDQVEGRIRVLCDRAAGGADLSPPPGEAHRMGLAHSHDGFLAAAAGLLKARLAIRDRLAALDPTADEGRAAAVRQAIAEAGGVEAVTVALAPSMASPAAESAARVRQESGRLADRIRGIDPETRLASELARHREALEARAKELDVDAADERDGAAAAVVAAALTGRLEPIAALESFAGGALPELAAALSAVRGDDAELSAVVAEMIEPRA